MLELVGEFLLSFFIEPILDGVIAPLLAPTFKQESSLRTNSIRLVITLILNSAIAGSGGWLLFESATASPVSGVAIAFWSNCRQHYFLAWLRLNRACYH